MVKRLLMKSDTLDLNRQWCRYLEEEERFWNICLKVARAKPYLCAEDVELEAIDIMYGLKSKSK